jgi:hypothetical protein
MKASDTRRPAGAARRILRALATCCLGLALAGCGLGLIYPRLDTVVGLYLERLVTLDEAQSRQLDAVLAGNLDWHRDSELAKYATLLNEVAQAVETGADRADWQRASDEADRYWRNIFVQAAPGYTALAATFTSGQVEELLANLAEQDEEEWREYADRTPSQRAARREKTVRRALERFVGPLTAGQRDLVRDYAVAAPSMMAEWRENRRVWRDALAAALARRHLPESFAEAMTRLIARPDELWTPQYRTALARHRAAFIDLLVALDGTLTAGQRRTARRQLVALADEVHELAGRQG